MTRWRQLGNGLLALMLSGGLASICVAQRQEHSSPRPHAQARQGGRPAAHPRNSPSREQKREQRNEEAPATRADRPPNSERQGIDQNRSNFDRPANNHETTDPNRPPYSPSSRGVGNNFGAYRNYQQPRLSPEERQRVLQNRQRFRQLSPQQQQEMRERSRVWQEMTPQQRDHIRYQVLPMWRNMPAARQKAIEQRLGVLQNMPERARNEHLADPNFTRGMSEEDRATLRDLSHLHVGGAPDAPHE